MDQPADGCEQPVRENPDDVDIEFHGPAVPATDDEILEVTLADEEDASGQLPALSPLDAAVAEADVPWVDVPAVCARAGQPFAVRFQERTPGQYAAVGARTGPSDSRRAGPGLGGTVKGQFSLSEYTGCPVCGSPGLIECDGCQTVTCGSSARETKQGLVIHCPSCGREGEIASDRATVIVPTEPQGKKGKLW